MHPQHERRSVRLRASPGREAWFHHAPTFVVIAACVRVCFLLAILTLRALPGSTTFFRFPSSDDPVSRAYPADQRFLPVVADPFGPAHGTLNATFDAFLGMAWALIVLNGVVLRVARRGRRPFRNPSWAGSVRERAAILVVASLAVLELAVWGTLLGLFYAIIDAWLGSPATIEYLAWLEAELPERSDLDARGRVLYPLLHVLQAGVAITALEIAVRTSFLAIGRVFPSSWRSAALPDTGKVTLEYLDSSDGVLAKGFEKMLAKGRAEWARAAQQAGASALTLNPARPAPAPAGLPTLRLDDNLAYWKTAPYRDNTYTGLAAQGLVCFGLFCVSLQLATFGVMLRAEWDRVRCVGLCSLTWAGPVYWVLFVVGMFVLIKTRVPLGKSIAGPLTVAWTLKILFVVGAALNAAAVWWMVEELNDFDHELVAVDVVGILYGIGCLAGVLLMAIVLFLQNKKSDDP